MPSLDLQRIAAIIAEEVIAALDRVPGPSGCACGGVVHACCPERRGGVIDAGALRVERHADAALGADVASLIDHTLLEPDATRSDIEKLVINVGALKSGDLCLVEADVAGVVRTCRDSGVLSKVIIEAALLTEEEKVAACILADVAGADYVKTSTGFGPGGATAADVALMRRVVGPGMRVKAAGSVRDYQTLRTLVMAGASRIGASAGVRIVQESRARTADPGSPGLRKRSGAGDGDRTRDQQLGKL